jgi:hypothetical protein
MGAYSSADSKILRVSWPLVIELFRKARPSGTSGACALTSAHLVIPTVRSSNVRP